MLRKEKHEQKRHRINLLGVGTSNKPKMRSIRIRQMANFCTSLEIFDFYLILINFILICLFPESLKKKLGLT